MELTGDMIALQGILSSLFKSTGEFTKINFRGGNEDKILDIVTAIHEFLSKQEGLYQSEDKKLDFRIHHKGLEEITIFLALNTNFKHSLELPEYSHLMNITPTLSKCLFINILCGLELCRYLCSVINIIPMNCSTELLDEIVPYLKKMPPKVHLDYSHMFLKAAASKLTSVNFSQKVESEVDNLSDVTNIILRNLSGIYSDQMKNWKAAQIYQHMAYCLLDLFDLLLYCDQSILSLQKFIGNVIMTCCSVVKNITINVFCSWAEIKEEDGTLQILVSNKAYSVIDSYQKHPDANELIGMLGAIAKKPMTLTELIYMADIDMMIRKVNKDDQEQKSWFKALLGTKKFDEDRVIECLSCYYYLCCEDDVNLLLNCYVESKDPRVQILIQKSAASLSLEQLIQVATRHFYRNKFKNILTSDNELKSTLDKIKQSDDKERELPRKIILFLLDSPENALKYIYIQCLRSSFHTDCLRSTFSSIREIAKIDNFGITTLLCVLDENPPNSHNCENIIALFRALTETEFFSEKTLALKIVGPLISKFYEAQCIEELNIILEILEQYDVVICVSKEFEEFVKLLLKIMNEFRCRFLRFDGSRQMIVKHIVDIFCDKCESWNDFEVNLGPENEDQYTNYYRQILSSSKEYSILESLCPEFDISSYGKCLHQIIQTLPPMVGREWMMLAKDLIQQGGHDKCVELLTDLLILLSQVVETQNNENIISALKHCLRNYGLVIQHEIHKNSTVQIEVNVNKHVCRLLAKLPEGLKEEQGLLLINTLTDVSLKSLANDREFLCLLVLIKNSNIGRVLAQKISQ